MGESVIWKGNLSHYYFHIAEILRGQNQPVDQVTAAALLYGQIYTLPMCESSPIFEIEHITHFCPLSCQILSYINIFNINSVKLNDLDLLCFHRAG